jgi:single-stranded-DNA-specific exonuclease
VPLQDILIGFGGHKNAAGLSLPKDKLNEFKTRINQNIDSNIRLHIADNIIGELDIFSFDIEFINILESFEPFGQNNKKPLFLLKGIKIVELKYFGTNLQHIRIKFIKNNQYFEAIDFNTYTEYIIYSTIDIIVSIHKNEYMGNVTPQLFVSN